MRKSPVTEAAALALGFVFCHTAAHAQTQASPDPADARVASPSGSEEIIVTAQRRSERLIDVPASITAVSAETLAMAGVTNTSDLAKVVPGVKMTFYGSFLQPAIRGVTSTGANLGENSNVALYIDGVYQPQQIATLIDLPDVAQVEVLKGPQGALYGQNATGGAILVSSLQPSFTPTGKFSASYGNNDSLDMRGYVSAPLNNVVAASLAGAWQKRNGFRTQVVTGQRDSGLESGVLRGKLLVEPSSKAKITLSAYFSDRSDSSAYAGIALNGNSVGYAFDPLQPKVTDPSQFSADPNVYTHIRGWGGNIRAEVDVGIGVITTLSALTRNRVDYLADADYTNFPFVQATADGLNGNYFTQDLNFVSTTIGPASFLVGAFYLNGHESFVHNRGTVFPFPLLSTDQNARVEKAIFAGYAEVTLRPADRVVLTAGGRYTREQQRTFSDLVVLDPALGRQKFSDLVEYPNDPVSFAKFTPRVTARYELSPRSNIYLSIGQGFKSGVVNTTDYTVAVVRPETITSYEIGFKGHVNDALRVDISGFLYNYKDLQAVAYQPTGGGYVTQNAARARIKGIDFNLQWNATPEITISGGGVLLDAKYIDFPNAVSFMPTGFGHVTPPAKVDLSGQRLLRSPTFSGNVMVNYKHEARSGTLGAFASLYYSSRYSLEYTNRIQQEAFSTIDAELSYAPSALRGLRLVLWGKNLTDHNYLASALIAGGVADGVSYAEPRTYGVRAEFQF